MIKTGDSSKGYTKRKVLAAIQDSAGIVTTIASKIGCTWGTARKLVDQWPETREAYQDEREKILDMSETTLLKAIKTGDVGSAKWMLSTQGKDRGYNTGPSLEDGEDGQATFLVSFVSPKKERTVAPEVDALPAPAKKRAIKPKA